VRLADSFIFNGDLIRLFMLARNLLFVLNRVDRRRFDKLVSQEMEPQLIEQAEAVLARLPGIEIVRNHDWNDGEIDLLVYSPTENIALHVQVKAAIPPQGARMVQAIESRAREGLKQLARFGELEATRRDEVLSDALGHDVRDVAVMDVLLSRTSFGTSALWRDAGAVAFVNLLLLAEIVAGADAKAPLADFDVRASTRLDEIVSLAKPKWVEREIDLDVVKLRLPILEYEFEALARSRADAWQRVGVLP
jgi:Holliday junction resolvase-like predicted endonuclease